MSRSHTNTIVNWRTQRTAFSVIKLLQNDAKERFRDRTFPFNPQLANHTSTFEYKNIKLFSEWRRMRHNYSHPACQCNRGRKSFTHGPFWTDVPVSTTLALSKCEAQQATQKASEKLQFDSLLCHLRPSSVAFGAPSLKSGGDHLHEVSAFCWD